MNRLNDRSKILSHRLPPRVMVFGGAALGLLAGVAAFGSVSTAADATPAAATTAKAPGAAAPMDFAACAKGAKLEKGVCVVHVVRTVVAPESATAAGASASNATPSTIPASTLAPAAVATPAQAAAARAAQPADQVADKDDDDKDSSAPRSSGTSMPSSRDTGTTSRDND